MLLTPQFVTDNMSIIPFVLIDIVLCILLNYVFLVECQLFLVMLFKKNYFLVMCFRSMLLSVITDGMFQISNTSFALKFDSYQFIEFRR